MAEHVNRLTVIGTDGTEYSCITYTIRDEAIPPQVDDSSCLKVLNNGVTGYFGLYPVDASKKSEYSSPLTAKIDGVSYYVETEVVHTASIKLPITINQTIELTYIDLDGNEVVITTKSGGEYPAKYDSVYTIKLIPDDGYTAGVVSNGESSGNPITGYVKGTTEITVSSASNEDLTVTIIQEENQTIIVNHNGTSRTSTFTGKYGDSLHFNIRTSNIDKYEPGTITVNGSTVLPTILTESLVVRVSPAVVRQYEVIISQSRNQIITVTCNGVPNTESFFADYGSELSYDIVSTDPEKYVAGNVYVDDSVHRPAILTGIMVVWASEATLAQYRLTIRKASGVTVRVDGPTNFTADPTDGDVVEYVPYGSYTITVTLLPDYDLEDISITDDY